MYPENIDVILYIVPVVVGVMLVTLATEPLQWKSTSSFSSGLNAKGTQWKDD